MPIMTSKILKSVDFTKIQKSRYLEDETLKKLNIWENSSITRQGLFYGKKKFCSGGNLKKAALCKVLYNDRSSSPE